MDSDELAEIEAMAAEEMDMEYEDDGYIELVLKVLGLMCDGQNGRLQVGSLLKGLRITFRINCDYFKHPQNFCVI